ncbi:MAG: 3'(2'),5'-bisphosphate nucleotidase CysQ [Thermomicrobiales bacterium]|nr:3'(2'),5'-bisphosphate nucleotidase CysQ [Thermomicrobiales bacterium]
MAQDARPYQNELDAAIAAAVAAGEAVKDLYDRAAAATYAKGDGSPVTDADLAADRAIREVLAARFPHDPILSEEVQDDLRRLESDRCWIVDPIDGTEQFIARTGEFDVLVAFAEQGRPVAAAGYQPTTGTLVVATKGGGAWVRRGGEAQRPLRFAPAGDAVRLASSKWFGAPENAPIMRALAEKLGVAPERATVTGISPRMFIEPRAIDAMIGVRIGGDQFMAFEWDFAVGDLVFHEGGGVVTDLEGAPLRYNKPVPRNEGGLVAAADPGAHAQVLAALREVRENLAADR